jgi:hypothetical protein
MPKSNYSKVALLKFYLHMKLSVMICFISLGEFNLLLPSVMEIQIFTLQDLHLDAQI